MYADTAEIIFKESDEDLRLMAMDFEKKMMANFKQNMCELLTDFKDKSVIMTK